MELCQDLYCSSLILLVTNLLHPVDNLAGFLLLNGDVRHGRGRRSAVQMVLPASCRRLAIDQFLQILRVPSSLHRNLRTGVVDLAEIVWC
jgi:hypothetical protein